MCAVAPRHALLTTSERPRAIARRLRRMRASRVRSTLSLFVAGSVWAAACGGDSSSVPSRPPRERGVGALLGAQPEEATKPSTESAPPTPPPLAAAAPEAQGGTPEAAPPPAEEDKPRRNFQSELVQLVGSPLDCLKARPAEDAPSSLEISLSTKVMPSGAVAQSEVSAPGLEPDEIACLRRRVENIHFAAPIENAPFPVSGSLRLTRGAPAKL